jgi:hypothetical protein
MHPPAKRARRLPQSPATPTPGQLLLVLVLLVLLVLVLVLECRGHRLCPAGCAWPLLE